MLLSLRAAKRRSNPQVAWRLLRRHKTPPRNDIADTLMRLYLGGHLNWYDPLKRSRIEVHLSEPTLLSAVLQNLGIPEAEIAVGVVNHSAFFSLQDVRVADADKVELFPPVGGG